VANVAVLEHRPVEVVGEQECCKKRQTQKRPMGEYYKRHAMTDHGTRYRVAQDVRVVDHVAVICPWGDGRSSHWIIRERDFQT